MSTINIAVCDDEADEREEILQLIKRYHSGWTPAQFSSAKDLLHATEKVEFDLILLDIEMASPTGFEVAKQIVGKQQSHPLIIFIFKVKERKALETQIQQTEREIAEKLDKIPDTLKADGYPDVQTFMDTFRKMEGVVEQYNRDLAEWEQQVKEKGKPKRPPEKESVRERLRQLQAEGKQQRTRKKSQDRER